MEKQKRRLLIFAVIALLVVLIVISCDLPGIPEILKGTGIWGKSKYGKAVYGGDKRGILVESINKEDNDLWK